MTREIKFRGKRVDNDEWVYGYYIKHLPFTPAVCQTPEDSEYQHVIIKDGFSDWNMPRNTVNTMVIGDTIGQFTGLQDKNGVDVYEGDRFNIGVDKYNYYQTGSGRNKSFEPKFSHKEEQRFIVVYNIEGFNKGRYTLKNEESHTDIYKVEKLEIVNNIHDKE